MSVCHIKRTLESTCVEVLSPPPSSDIPYPKGEAWRLCGVAQWKDKHYFYFERIVLVGLDIEDNVLKTRPDL